MTLFVLAAGCDLTGQYDKKFQQALEDSAKKAKFESNLHSTFTDVIDASRQPVGVKLRLPRILDASSKTELVDPSKALAKAAIPIPPGAAGALAGGSVYSITKVLDGPDGQKLPFGVAMTVLPKGPEMKLDAMQAAMSKSLAAVAPGSSVDDATFTTPSGQPLTLKRMRLEVSAPVPGAKGGAKLDNRRDYYFVDAGKQMVMIMWIVPKSLGAQYKLDEAIDASMGTLEVTAQPADAPAGKT